MITSLLLITCVITTGHPYLQFPLIWLVTWIFRIANQQLLYYIIQSIIQSLYWFIMKWLNKAWNDVRPQMACLCDTSTWSFSHSTSYHVVNMTMSLLVLPHAMLLLNPFLPHYITHLSQLPKCNHISENIKGLLYYKPLSTNITHFLLNLEVILRKKPPCLCAWCVSTWVPPAARVWCPLDGWLYVLRTGAPLMNVCSLVLVRNISALSWSPGAVLYNIQDIKITIRGN